MNTRLHIITIVLLLFAVSVGCGRNASVTGKVSFPDGTPLTEGEVIFESPALIAKGKIQGDGSYSISTGEETGIPKGTYQVALSGFQMEKITSGEMGKPPRMVRLPIPVDRKYLSPTGSGLTCEVKGRTTYDIEVEAPKK